MHNHRLALKSLRTNTFYILILFGKHLTPEEQKKVLVAICYPDNLGGGW